MVTETNKSFATKKGQGEECTLGILWSVMGKIEEASFLNFSVAMEVAMLVF